MSDPMMTRGMGQGGQPPGGQPPGMGGGVMRNLSPMNPADLSLMAASGNFGPDTTIREAFSKVGIDVDGPMTQLADYVQKMKQNANPLNKVRNIAADTALQRGGQPPTQPGVKPMVASPGQPAPSGMEGLLNRLGG